MQSVLEATVHRWKAKSATAIVLEPKTGEILAMGIGRRPTTTTTCTI